MATKFSPCKDTPDIYIAACYPQYALHCHRTGSFMGCFGWPLVYQVRPSLTLQKGERWSHLIDKGHPLSCEVSCSVVVQCIPLTIDEHIDTKTSHLINRSRWPHMHAAWVMTSVFGPILIHTDTLNKPTFHSTFFHTYFGTWFNSKTLQNSNPIYMDKGDIGLV